MMFNLLMPLNRDHKICLEQSLRLMMIIFKEGWSLCDVETYNTDHTKE